MEKEIKYSTYDNLDRTDIKCKGNGPQKDTVIEAFLNKVFQTWSSLKAKGNLPTELY